MKQRSKKLFRKLLKIMEQATAEVVESVKQNVSDFRDSALREKNIIIHWVDESEAEKGLERRKIREKLSLIP